MTTIARQANLRIADRTGDLAQLVINAQFAAIVADLIADIEAEDNIEEFEFECQLCGDGVDEVFCRLTEDGDTVEACERCVDKYRLAYVED